MKKSRFLMATALASSTLTLLAGPAWAQDAVPQAASDEAAGDEIVVTGSRIASPTLVSASPLQIVTDAAIQSTGASNLQDVLLQSPIFGTPAVSRTNSNFGVSGVGLATVDLRNLGTARTLVLVDGRRFVSGSPNDQAVDFNSIPTTFIERVEILTGGASSIYGSDAVAGVVNLIYKKNFQGLEANAQIGYSEEGDDKKRQLNLTIGGNFADDRGNIIAYVGYSRDGSVLSRDRTRSAIDQASTGAFVTGDAGDLFKITTPFLSSFAPQGRFFSAPGVTAGTFDANGNFITGFSTNGSATRAPDGFNRSFFRTIAVPVERFLIATRANYEISPSINVFLEGTFAKSHTESVLEPFPISTAGTNGIFQGSGGFYPVEQTLANGTIFVNPFVPAALLARLSDIDGDGLRDISFTRRLSDIDNRGNVADRTTYRIVAGVEGKISDTWRYDAYFNYGRTDDNQTSTGQVNLANFRSALIVTQDANGNLVCADVQARAQGCVPVNVYGRNTISAAAAKYIRADGNRSAFARQIDAGANISGSLFDPFGAGPVGVALGGEYRKESSAAAFDALQQAGLNGGNAIPNTSGSFDVVEGYGELRLPILRDKSFFKELTLKAAGRISDYSSIGSVFSYNYGAEYAPSNDIRFRAVYARATRAPNVGELFQGPSQNFPTGLNDPCVGVTTATTGTLGTQCRAFAGVNANIAANGAFTLNQADQQGISGFDSGNPNLKEERANTLTVGAIITPKSIDFLRGFSLTIDYSRTRIKGAVVGTPRQFILDQCFRQGVQSFCQFVTRRAAPEGANSAGSLQFINSGQTNSGGILNSAIDVTASYNKEIGGVLANASISYTHLFKYFLVPLPGAQKDQIAGEVGAAKDRFLLTLGAKIGAVNVQYRGTYIGRSFLDDQFVSGFVELDANGDPVLDSSGNPVPIGRHDPRVRVGAKIYSDLQASINAGDHFEFYAGVNNLFNTSPPPIISGLPANTTGAETDAGTYDAIGRRFYAGVRLKF